MSGYVKRGGVRPGTAGADGPAFGLNLTQTMPSTLQAAWGAGGVPAGTQPVMRAAPADCRQITRAPTFGGLTVLDLSGQLCWPNPTR